MIKSLKDARITDGLPRIVGGQEWVIAMSGALGKLHEKTLEYADKSQIYTVLDSVPEEVLDALAVNWKIDWYDTGYSIEQKRRVVKSSLTVRRLMGTAYAVRLQADAIFPGTKIEEWFDYGGEPGTFRLYVDITTSSEEAQVHDYSVDEMERRLVTAKRWSAHLESFSYMLKHALIIRRKVEQWRYRVPECGTIYCGTYWMPRALGHSEETGIKIQPAADTYAYIADYTGTKPEIATKGYSASGIIKSTGEADAYTASPAQSGTEKTGTLPEAAAGGYSIEQTLKGKRESGDMAEAFESIPSESGVKFCGTMQ